MRRFAFVFVLLGLTAPLDALAGTSNSLMDISADGRLLACSNRDNGTVSLVDLQSNAVIREIPVGHHPEGVSFLGETHNLAVAVYDEDQVLFIDGQTGKIDARIDVFDEPYGVVSNSDGSRVYVTLEYPGTVLEIDTAAHTVLRSLPAGKFLRGIAIEPGEERLLVSEYHTGIVKAIELKSGKVVDSWQGSRDDNLARQLQPHPTRPKVYLPHIRSKITVTHGAGSIFPYVTVIDSAPGEGRRRKPIAMDSFKGTLVVANPWELAISPDGQRLYVVFAGTDDMYVCDILDDNYREIKFVKVKNLGRNPRAVRVAPDNQSFYVYNALDFAVVKYDAHTLRPIATIPVCENPHDEQILLGKVLFYSAQQPMVGRRWISCASCHPDGHSDGRTWHNPEGLRDTTALFGMAWTHPIHWSADRDEVQDFEHTIRSQLMQGRGLIRGDVNPALETPNRGLSAELDAIAAYSNSHKFTLSPHAKTGLNAAAKRGQKLFFDEETQCATCHGGPFFTDSRMEKPFRLHDVGTGNDDPSEIMGPKYDTPTLLGIYRTAPYLHHGKAKTLRDVLTTQNKNDQHGQTSHLSAEQIDDLVEFLKCLPYEDPEPAAIKAGLRRVD
ncbi:Lactonase, 7-bladed beta-propeller [Symmachiella dynata]|uniref:Lactonase, 7-bladed beta-propeller n=1 Tax=Symmachiella dynata TaxID=2527995 RepID=A0A517ZSC0_9PLAN|nr:c-type cytochrome [Symmachiella dynata]QDU45305.1 Lactonase, 7-bladed beta-propeller [Symmachiella dynata]